MWAAAGEHAGALRILMTGGGDVNTRAEDGWTALMLASRYGRVEIIRTLLENGADPNARSRSGETALIEAIGHPDAPQALLAYGADADVKDKKGSTALILATEAGDAEAVQVLLARGADVYALNPDKKTAFEIAKSQKRQDILDLLRKAAIHRILFALTITLLLIAAVMGLFSAIWLCCLVAGRRSLKGGLHVWIAGRMGLRSLPDTPAGMLFRFDLHRHWQIKSFWKARSLWKIAGLLIAVLAIQAEVSFLMIKGTAQAHLGKPSWVLEVLAFLGFSSPTGILALAIFPPGMRSYSTFALINMIPSWATHFLMPAYVVNTITQDRAQHRISEIAITRLTPRQIFVAKGFASLLPFLLLTLGGLIASTVWCLASHAFSRPVGWWLPPRGGPVPSLVSSMDFGRLGLLELVCMPLAFALDAGIMISIALKCRRTYAAMALCYAVQLLVLPLLSVSVSLTFALLFKKLYPSWGAYMAFFRIAVELVVLAVLLPGALKAVKYPEETGRIAGQASSKRKRPPLESRA